MRNSELINYVLCFVLIFTARASANGGREANVFLKRSPSVEMAALGGSQAAKEGGVSSLFSNPAATSGLEIPELALSYDQALFDTKRTSIGGGIRSGEDKLFGSFQFIDYGTGKRTGIDDAGDPVTGLGNFQYRTFRTDIGWSRQINHTGVGFSLKSWTNQRYERTTTSFAADGGILLRDILPKTNIGIAIRNLGPSSDNGPLPVSGVIGVGLNLLAKARSSLALYSELEKSSKSALASRTGLEWTQSSFHLRGGFDSSKDRHDVIAGFSFGAGVKVKGWKIDYAWIPLGDFGDEHRFALTTSFGLTHQERENAARNLDATINDRMKAKASENFQRGQQELKNNHLETAEQYFTSAAAWDPACDECQKKMNETRHAIADKLRRQSQKEAQTNVSKRKDKNHEIGRLDQLQQQAYTLYAMGEIDRAIRTWEKILQLDAGNSDAIAGLRAAKEKQHLTKTADSATLQKVDELNADALNAYIVGQLSRAWELWKEAARLDPSNIRIQNNLKRVEAEMAGQGDKSK